LNVKDNFGAKFVLILISLVTGWVAYGLQGPEGLLFSDRYDRFQTGRFMYAAGVTLLYPIVGAITVRICALIRKIAHLGKAEPWDEDFILFLAIVWPITLVVSIVLYPCLLITNLLF
jgi:hypothetical protein